MRFLKKNISWILLLVCVVSLKPMLSQNFGETSEHKKIWRIFGRKKHRDAYNPYVKNGKSTHEPSKKQARENKRLLNKQDKALKKQIRKNKRDTGLTK
jgi:hypothetical protein